VGCVPAVGRLPVEDVATMCTGEEVKENSGDEKLLSTKRKRPQEYVDLNKKT